MSSIWSKDGTDWRLLAPTGYPDEDALHTRVEQAPQMLPLAGSPRLTIVGREVSLGSGYADLIAVESSGRLVVIEVKLSRNAEARRAVVAQVLTYAAYLRGLDVATLEEQVLARHLRDRGYTSLADAVGADDPEGTFSFPAFEQGLTESLLYGRFRLVLVLDQAPEELVRLIGYLEAVTDGLLIDLVVITAFDVSGTQILVPQRIQPEEQRTATAAPTPSSSLGYTRAVPAKGTLTPGAEVFAESISRAEVGEQPALRRLYAWADSLEKAGLAYLETFQGVSNRWTLLPRIPGDKAGLVTIYNDRGAYIAFNRSVFERRAPKSLTKVETVAAPTRVGQGTSTRAVSEELLEALTDSYREAVAGVAATRNGDSAAS